MKINFVKILDDAVVPTRGSEYAAGYDMYAVTDFGGAETIEPHTTKLIHTGIKAAIPNGFFGGIYARSGLASKKGLRPANCVGVVDAR